MARGKYSHWHREGWVHRTKDLGRVRPKARTNTKSADPWQASEDRDEIIEASEILASRSPQALLPTSTPSLGQRYFMLTRPGHLTLLIASLFRGLHSNLGFTFRAPPHKDLCLLRRNPTLSHISWPHQVLASFMVPPYALVLFGSCMPVKPGPRGQSCQF